MIGSLKGVVAMLDGEDALIDVRGVGFEVIIPSRLSDSLSIGDEIDLCTHLHIAVVLRSFESTLYGFADHIDREVFRNLIGINKLGPKTAVSIISKLSGVEIARAIQAQDEGVLARVPGIGKKTAAKVVFELRDAVKDWNFVDFDEVPVQVNTIESLDGTRALTIAALRQLGFSKAQADTAVHQVWEEDLDVSTLTQRALAAVRQY